MSRIVVVTDSAACIPNGLTDELQIQVIPFNLIWNGTSYRDRIDLDAGTFYSLFRQNENYPTTSQPSLGDFVETYKRLSQRFDGIVSIHVPQEVSSTCQTAFLASIEASAAPVRVIDARTAAAGQGMVVLAAARAAAEGASLSEVVAAAQSVIDRVELLATLETLEHIRRGGRVTDILIQATATLRLNPIMKLKQGRISFAGLTRTREDALEKMLEQMAKALDQKQPIHAAVFHADALDEAMQVQQVILERFQCIDIFLTEFTPVMGAHTGPGVIGIAYYGG